MTAEVLSLSAHPVQVGHRVLVPVLGMYNEAAVGLTEHAVRLRHPAGFLEPLLEEAIPTVARDEQSGSRRGDVGSHALRTISTGLRHPLRFIYIIWSQAI